MNNNVTALPAGAWAALRRFSRRAAGPEPCEFCSARLAAGHRHLLELASGKIICACDPCALRFENVAEGRWKLIPREARRLLDFRLTDQQWQDLALPINLAFFFQTGRGGRVRAMYPSPAGVTESLLPLASWAAVQAENPALAQMQPDVESLLANRVGTARDYYLAPIDRCYELAGLIRLHWRGLAGGDSVWREIEKFFAGLDACAISPESVPSVGPPAAEAAKPEAQGSYV